MKRFFTLQNTRQFLAVTFLSMLLSYNAMSQCAGYFQHATLTPACGTYTNYTFDPGGYVLTTVVTGAQYHFNSCGSSNSDYSCSIYDATGATNLGYADDNCLNASGSNIMPDLVWTSTVTANVRAVSHRFNSCASPYGWFSGLTSAVFSIRQENNITAPAPTGTTTICSGSSTTLTASPTAGAGAAFSYLWYKNGASTGITTSTLNTGALAANASYYYIATLGQCSTTSGTTTVTVNTPPGTAAAGVDKNTCALAGVAMTGNTIAVGTATWTVVSGGSGTFGNANLATTTFTPTSYGAITLRWTFPANGSCPGSSDDVIVNSYQSPGTAAAGGDQNSCALAGVTLAGNAIAVGTGTWTVVSGGTGTFSNANSPTSTFTPTSYGAITLQWTFPANGTCAGSNDQVVINSYQSPGTAAAGADKNTCALAGVAMTGNAIAVGTGTWTVVSGGTGNFSNANSPTSTFTPTSYGAITLRWTFPANGSCAGSSDDVIINSYQSPGTAAAGGDQNSCALAGVTLAGNAIAVGTGTWTVVSGGTGTFSNANSPTSTFTPTSYGAITLQWTFPANGTCAGSNDQVVINSYQSPGTASVGATQYRCGTLTSAALGGNAIAVGTATWTIVSGGTGTFSNANSPSSTFTANTYGTYVLRWTFPANGTCAGSSADITINYTEQATVGTTPQSAPCNTLTSTTLGGNTPTLGTGAWSLASGPGSVTSWNPSAATPGATATVSNYGSYTLRWTVTNLASGCNTSADIVVNYNQSPVVSGPTSVCDIETNVQYNSSVPGVAWTVNSGIGSIGGGSGQYTSGNIGTPTQTSAVVIRATNITCSTDYNVTVYNKATINPIANQCEGSVVTLGSDVDGVSFSGTGVSGGPFPTAYTWTAPTPVSGSSQNINITLSNGLFGCGDLATVTSYKTLTITPTNPISVCDVSSVPFTSNLSVTNWNITSGTGSFTSPTGTNTTYNPANIATTTQSTATTVTATNGECVVTRNITNYNDNSIVTANNTPVCDASTLVIDGDVDGVTWSSAAGGSVTTGVQDPTFTPSDIALPMQNTTVVVTATNGTCVAKNVTIRVDNDNSILTAGPTPVCDNITQLIDGDVSGVTWSSAPGGSVTSPGEDATFTPTALGVPLSANVVVTATNGACTPKTITMEVRKASTAPTSLTPSTGFVECVGDAFTLTAGGATLGYGASYKLYSGSCGGTLVATNGTGIFAPTPGATTTYYARVEGCNTTTCQNATITANSPVDLIPASGVKVCVYDGTISGDKYLVNSSNEALLSIDEGSYNLGNVSATVTTFGSAPAQAGSIQCDAPAPSSGPVGGDELYLPRQFDITTQNVPGGFVTVSLYFTQAELTALANATSAASAAYQSCWGTVASNGSNLMLTIEHSPSSYETRLQGSGLTISAGPWANTYKATFQVNQFSGFKLHGNGGVNGANGLPVEMIYFEANAVNNAFIQLTWATALEINNDGFYVERSVDGQNWAQLDFVNGHDNSTVQQDYSYNDMDVVPGVRYYYRLLQVDNDGQSEHTGVRTAMLNGEVTFNVMDFVPNPTMNQTTLIVTATKEQSISVDIYDVIGQKVMSTVNQLNKGANSIKFDLSTLAAGTYTAAVSARNETYSKKLIITR